MADVRTQPLTIYLSRNGTSARDLVDADKTANITPLRITIEGTISALLYIDNDFPEHPDWAQFFDDYVQENAIAKNRSVSALLLIEFREKLFALTFGHGRFLMNQDFLEEQFGLKVALNCIGTGNVRSITKHSLDQILRHSQEQASRDATAGEFGFDIEQDLLKGVTGKPTDTSSFGSRISGKQAFQLSLPVNLRDIPDVLGRVSDKFLDTSYKNNFPWVDQISEISNEKLQNELDEQLVREIMKEDRRDVWMAVPDLIDWARVSKFRFVTQGYTYETVDIHLDYFLDFVEDTEITPALLKRKRVECLDPDGRALVDWPVYKCLYAELDRDTKSYLLSGGKWYIIKSDFVQQVDQQYSEIKTCELEFPEFQHRTEGDYLKEVSDGSDGIYALMDQNFINAPSKMEFCDLYSIGNDICHVKRYGQAGALSHLFAQGLVSGELFKRDKNFRKDVNDRLPETHKIANHEVPPKDGDYRVVFAIISDRPDPLRIPFFSRLNFKHAADRLGAYGYRVGKVKIKVNEAFAKTKKCEAQRKKKQ